MKYKEDLSIKLLFLPNDENALRTFLHSTDEMCLGTEPPVKQTKKQTKKKKQINKQTKK